MWKHFGQAGRGVGRGAPHEVHVLFRGLEPVEYARKASGDVREG